MSLSEEIKSENKNKSAGRRKKGQVRVVPQTFALDEKTNQGLVVFETLKTKTKFSLYLNSSVDVELFLKESFNRQESGFLVAQKIYKKLGLSQKKGLIKGLDPQKGAWLYLESKTGETQKISLGLLELLGLWTLDHFPLYATKSFIEDCRDIKVDIKETSTPLKADLYKKYGQKYLM